MTDKRRAHSNAAKNAPHPIQYQGSKRNLASLILAYFPQTIDRLIEPFAGSAAITNAARRLAKSYYESLYLSQALIAKLGAYGQMKASPAVGNLCNKYQPGLNHYDRNRHIVTM